MILFPAIDMKNGKCVRLRQGRADEVTVFADDPVSMARHWADLGCSWLHVVDLDGAFEGKPVNAGLVKRICREVSIPIQLGGGIRSSETAEVYLDSGVTRLIIGTMALETPDRFASLCRAFPGRIGVSLDAQDGVLKTRGWVGDSGRKVDEVLPQITEAGTAFVVYTDISRDGMHSGVNIPALENLTDATDLPVLAAGGVSTLEDLRALRPLAKKGLSGVITGRAIYDGTLDVPRALALLSA